MSDSNETRASPIQGSPGVDQAKLAARPAVEVVIGTSKHADDPVVVADLLKVVIEAYSAVEGHKSMSAETLQKRLRCGDAGDAANRVLHLAFNSEGKVVGCISSTLTAFFLPAGCGHWGFLAVSPEAQGTGVASALVAAAEARLREASMAEVRIEYFFSESLPHTVRLEGWYEGKLGFVQVSGYKMNRFFGIITGGWPKEFRRCQKKL